MTSHETTNFANFLPALPPSTAFNAANHRSDISFYAAHGERSGRGPLGLEAVPPVVYRHWSEELLGGEGGANGHASGVYGWHGASERVRPV